MGLVFLSAVGLALADNASLQNDKANLNTKVGNDQKGISQADSNMGEDTNAINSSNDNIKSYKKSFNEHYANLLRDRRLMKEAEAKGDLAKAKSKKADIMWDHRALNKDEARIKRARINRKASIKDLKNDRSHRDSDVSKLNDNDEKLDKTNEKMADQKQDSATK